MTMQGVVPGGTPVKFTLTLDTAATKLLIVPDNAVFLLQYFYCISVMDANVANRTLEIQILDAASNQILRFFTDVLTASQNHQHQFGLGPKPLNDPPGSLEESRGDRPIYIVGLDRLAISLSNEQAADVVTLRGVYLRGPNTLPT